MTRKLSCTLHNLAIEKSNRVCLSPQTPFSGKVILLNTLGQKRFEVTCAFNLERKRPQWKYFLRLDLCLHSFSKLIRSEASSIKSNELIFMKINQKFFNSRTLDCVVVGQLSSDSLFSIIHSDHQ